ncbi:mannose-6-phosphate isomerase [Rhizobium sp. RU33A]|uniref:AGE family epimerase/isomerase n=1 Tax=Rhizobium sp. RU33A TaxID=1907413 RepID=UPI0009562E9A|nr:AGE family epimerase/isomerase [Rhizobium sp. RU33A]SIQ02894.1 mannose-6-phosphate isomerase [Rhizobium sp. RU33A]
MSVQQLKRVFLEDILPTWSKSGFDETCGQFVEHLELDGAPQEAGEVRTRTVARQIYVHAHAAHVGVAPSASLAMAERAFANLHRVAWVRGKRGGYTRSFNRHTELVTDPVRDLYDNACVLLALSWLLTATGKDVYRHQIEQTILAIDRTLADPFGGWAEDSNGTLPRRQNPHMHYLEATLALCENNRTPKHMRSEGKAFALLRSHFLVAPNGPLHEFFGPQWELAERYGSDRLEPGHMCEWVWLATRHDSLARSDNTKICLDLLSTALAVGRTPGSLFLVDTVSADKPISPSRRLWPQVEMLKAFMALHERLGCPGYRTEADDVASAILAAYMTGVPHGCWHDCLDLNEVPTARTIPASSLYHLWTALAKPVEDVRLADSIRDAESC